ncbi:MAG: hypothetical protein ACON42_05025 [Flavobacteriaceae bacterium]
MDKASHTKTSASQAYPSFDTPKEPRKTFQTFLRNQNRLYIHSFNFIDRKAAIMIRMNSTIISVIVIFFDYIIGLPQGRGIGLTMVITSFFSLMFALNASRPHTFYNIVRFRKTVKKYRMLPEEQIFILGASAALSVEEYLNAFRKIVNDQKLQIGNQVKIMYLLEKRVRASFLYIEISYLIFMIGFLVMVFLFIRNNIFSF